MTDKALDDLLRVLGLKNLVCIRKEISLKRANSLETQIFNEGLVICESHKLGGDLWIFNEGLFGKLFCDVFDRPAFDNLQTILFHLPLDHHIEHIF